MKFLTKVNVVGDVSFVDEYTSVSTFTQRYSNGIGLLYLMFTILILL